MSDFDAVRRLHADVVSKMGHEVDILYNNAAMGGTVLGIRGKIENVNLDEMEKCWRVNAGAAFLVRPVIVCNTGADYMCHI